MAKVEPSVGGAKPGAIAIGLICALLLIPAPAWAGPADLDAGFGEGGIVDLARAPTERFPGLFTYAVDMAPGPDETVLVLSIANECSAVGCRYPMIVTRYGADGSPDLAYGDRGSATPAVTGNGEARLAVDSHGRTLIAVKEGATVRVVRLAADGSPDRSFAGGGEAVAPGARNSLIDLAVSAGDKIVIESDWSVRHPGHGSGNGDRAPERGNAMATVAITRLLPSGDPDTSFGHTGSVRVSFRRASPPTAIAIRPRGGVLLAGAMCCSEHPVPYLARILADGRPDPGFGRLPGLRRLRGSEGLSVTALLPRPDGKIDVGGTVRWGNYTGRQGGFLLRLRGDGTAYRRFGRGGMRLPTMPVDAAATDTRGRTFVVSVDESAPELTVFRLRPNGSLDRSFAGKDGEPVHEAAGGEGSVLAAYSGLHPLVFNPRIYICRSTCPPAPVLARLVGGPGDPHHGH